MHKRVVAFISVLPAILGGLYSVGAGASVPLEELPSFDATAARETAVSHIQFASPIPHVIDPLLAGTWNTREDGTSAWSYAVRIPGARSVSFHASTAFLPEGAYLSINGFRHKPIDIAVGQLWSRTVAGDTMHLDAIVPTVELSRFRLHITELYAGFAPFLPHASSAKPVKADQVCEQVNYSCESQRDVGNSVARMSVNGGFGCTATLINNTSGDLDPLLISAAHCYTATGAVTAEVAAQTLVVYWRDQVSCGQSLDGSGAVVTQNGASSLASVGDSWLVRLNQGPPPSANAFWAGFDATDANPGGDAFSIHHGGGPAKQYTHFAVPVKGTLTGVTPGATPAEGTPSWEAPLVRGEQLGGASGAALFDSHSRVLGPYYGGSSNCEDKAPNEPGQGNSGFTRLAYSFDGTLVPGTAFKPYLDPGNTGRRVTDGRYASAGPAGNGGNGGGGGGLAWAALSVLLIGALRRTLS